MKDLITTKEEPFEKFKGLSEANIKALVQKTMLGVYSEKNKLEDVAMKWKQLDNFYEYVKAVNWHLNTNERPGGMSDRDYNELIEVLGNNN